jgi:hypothetical protein
MSDDELELSIMSNDELEASLKPEEEGPQGFEEVYTGPERRSGRERRVGPKDRRDLVRFDPENAKADRRSGVDRRKENRKPEDKWDDRDF